MLATDGGNGEIDGCSRLIMLDNYGISKQLLVVKMAYHPTNFRIQRRDQYYTWDKLTRVTLKCRGCTSKYEAFLTGTNHP